MQDLFHSLSAVLGDIGENDAAREAIVFAAWLRTAGPVLADHTAALELREKRLVVGVADNMWKRHLEDLSGQMLFKLNSLLGSAEVTFIEFRVDEPAVRSRRHAKATGERADAEAAMTEITPEMRHAALAIDDEELRGQFLLAAGSCLARLKRLESME
jgi:hypothetical protein